jgi:hypothetical protein
MNHTAHDSRTEEVCFTIDCSRPYVVLQTVKTGRNAGHKGIVGRYTSMESARRRALVLNKRAVVC